MNEKETIALIESYLHGEMTAGERVAFEARLQSDAVLAEQLQAYRELTGTFRAYHQRQALKARLNQIHAQMEEPLVEEPPALEPAVVRSLWRQHYSSIAMAASVALIAVLMGLLSMNMWRSTDKKQTAGYQELRREVERIKKNQRAIVQEFIQPETKPEVNPGNFSGTGFALTPEGYIVTSYHVVKDADSVFIENGKGERYKVKNIFQDQKHDLALLQVDDPAFTSFGKLPYTLKRTSADLGERVFTLGFPREDLVYGEGSISAKTGFAGDSLSYQISVPVNPGNSGGPLLDSNGNLIGVISGKQMDLVGTSFAVKSEFLLSLIEGLPADSLKTPVRLPKNNMLAGTSRTQQLKKLQDLVFVVKVYNQ
jgi:serine protease Do